MSNLRNTTSLDGAAGLLRSGRFTKAETMARALYARDPTSIAIVRILSEACRRQGKLDDAANVLRDAILHAPNVSDLHSRLGLILLERQAPRDVEAAVAACREAVRIDPKN